jgi:Lon protease-like protein
VVLPVGISHADQASMFQMKLHLLIGVPLLSSAFTVPPLTRYEPLTSKLRQPSSFYALPDDENEEELAARMDLVRQLEKSFYQNEDVVLSPSEGTTIMKDLPLWRVQWTELPGFQNVLNVHVPHYTNMFKKIIYSDANPKYFGHIYLPGGSDNLDNPEYKLEEGTKSSMVGVLMKISDYKEMNDGRLTPLVQAVEKFRIVEAQRHHSPYAVATVEIIPDEEFIESFEDDFADSDDLGRAVESAFQLHPYEMRPISIEDCAVEGEIQGISVSPLSNFDADFKIPKTMIQGNVDEQDVFFETELKVGVSKYSDCERFIPSSNP